jgi:hypothetical protein
VTLPHPADDARPQLTDELRRARSAEHDPDADLVPVEGGEPMPAEERPTERPSCP